MSDLKDDNGKLVTQELTRLARKGGGFYDYVWPKYSKETGSIPKRAYVIELPTWGWMLGSGVYLDDVDDALSEIDTQVSRNIEDTMLWIAGIAFLSTVAIFLGLMLNIRERTAMDDKLSLANTQLKAQAQRVRDAQDEERERMKNDLHDCVQPMLVAVKMKIETGLATLPEISEAARSQVTFKSAAKLSKETLNELRKIIRGIYPIDPDLNLASKLTKLAMDMSHVTLQIEFVAEEEIHGLTGEEEEALYLIAKIALNNIEEHAAAHQASVRMEATEHYIKLSICDDGGGFDVNRISDHSSHGIGLRNMKKRLESVGGLLTVTSSPNGTCVVATINLPTG